MVDGFSTALKFHAETESLLDNVVSDLICKEGGVSLMFWEALLKKILSLISSVRSIGTFYMSAVMSHAQ